MELIKGFFNLLADPRLFFFLTSAALALMVWKREAFAENRVGYGLLLALTVWAVRRYQRTIESLGSLKVKGLQRKQTLIIVRARIIIPDEEERRRF